MTRQCAALRIRVVFLFVINGVNMFLNILTHAPIWVWPLFFLLVFVGIRSSQKRDTPLIVLYILPFLGLLSLNRATTLKEPAFALLALGVCYGIGIALGYRAQGHWIIEKTPRRVSLRGEWITFATIMILFLGNFAVGILTAIAPVVASGAAFALTFGAIAGLVSGSLLGRTLRVAIWPVQTA